MADWTRHLPPELHELYLKELQHTIDSIARRQRNYCVNHFENIGNNIQDCLLISSEY